jgi:glyoxylate reductase
MKLLIPMLIPRKGFEDVLPDFEVIYPVDKPFSEQEILERIKDCNVLVSIFGQRVNNSWIDAAPELKLIANYGAGFDNIDVAYATSKGIVVTNCPDPVTEPTAELAFGLMISLARGIAGLNNRLKNNRDVVWGVMNNLTNTLVGKQLGIVGMGAIGRALARRAKASGMSIVYNNRNRVSEEIEKELGAQWVSMEKLLKESDVVSLNVPLTSQTKQMIGANELKMMKTSALLINTARGAVVDQSALIDALQNGIIAAAGLDVFENEPSIPDELLALSNVVLTPHTGSATIEARAEMSRVVAGNIRQFVDGIIPVNIVNKEVLKSGV